jgi:hypothetical protein
LNIIVPSAYFCAPAAVALGNKIYVFYVQHTSLIDTFHIQSIVGDGTSWVSGSDPQITLTAEMSMLAACPIPKSNALALFYIPGGSDLVTFKTMTSDGVWSNEQTLPSLPTSFAGGEVAACHNTTTGRTELCAVSKAPIGQQYLACNWRCHFQLVSNKRLATGEPRSQ